MQTKAYLTISSVVGPCKAKKMDDQCDDTYSGGIMLLQLGKFAAVGAMATLFQYAILVCLIEVFKVDAVWSSATGFIVSAVFNYLANYYFTFGSSEHHGTAIIRFVIVATAGLAINTIGMLFLIKVVVLHYFLSQVICTGLVFIWNFIFSRYWTYKSTI